LRRARQQIDGLRGEVASYKAELERLKRERPDLINKITKLQSHLDAAQRDKRRLRQAVEGWKNVWRDQCYEHKRQTKGLVQKIKYWETQFLIAKKRNRWLENQLQMQKKNFEAIIAELRNTNVELMNENSRLVGMVEGLKAEVSRWRSEYERVKKHNSSLIQINQGHNSNWIGMALVVAFLLFKVFAGKVMKQSTGGIAGRRFNNASAVAFLHRPRRV